MFSFSSKFSKIWNSFEGPGDEATQPPGGGHPTVERPPQEVVINRGAQVSVSPSRRSSNEQQRTLRSVASVFRQISSPRSTPSSPSFSSSNSREHEHLQQHHSLPTSHRTNPLLHRSIHRTQPPPSSMFGEFLSNNQRQANANNGTTSQPSASLNSSRHPIAFHHLPVQGAVDPYLVDPITASTSDLSILPSTTSHSSSGASTCVRKVHILKSSQDPPSGGFTVCGGPEVGLHGTIYISRVDKNSLADKCGLASGDQILSANYTSFLDASITCHDAFELICNSESLTLNVLPRKEAMTGQRRHHSYTWIDPHGRSVSPPPSDHDSSSDSSSSPSRHRKASTRLDSANELRHVTITMEKGICLGLMIRGGLEYGLGIYVTGIDSNTLADKSGLKVGDQIFYVNNYDFRNVLHDEAVDILRSSHRLAMKVRNVGKVPSSTAPMAKGLSTSGSQYNVVSGDFGGSNNSQGGYHFTRIPSSRCSIRRPHSSHSDSNNDLSCSPQRSTHHLGSPHRPSTSNSQTNGSLSSSSASRVPPALVVTDSNDEELLEQRLLELLDANERLTFAFYKNEYVTKRMTVDAYVVLILELLEKRGMETRDKYVIMDCVRAVIPQADLDKFDELMSFKRKEILKVVAKGGGQEGQFREDNRTASHRYDSVEDDHSDLVADTHKNGHTGKRYLPGLPANEHEEHDTVDIINGVRNNRRSLCRSDLTIQMTGSTSINPPAHSLSPLNAELNCSVGLNPRRHSSCATGVSTDNAISSNNSVGCVGGSTLHSANTSSVHLGVSNPDERRWSIAATHELPTEYTGSYYQRTGQTVKARSGSGSEMRAIEPLGRAREMRSGSGNHLQIPGSDDEYDLQQQVTTNDRQQPTQCQIQQRRPSSPTSQFLQSHSRVRRHRSLPSPTFINPVPPPLSSHHNHHRSSSFRLPHHRAQLEAGGRLRVTVKKSKPILGIAIEGGINVTTQQQPRIISIHSTGAAFETGDLHDGHIILEVDGMPTANLKHEEVAQMIADAYYNTAHKDFIEFVVREKSKNEFDIRRSSFMLLNNSFE